MCNHDLSFNNISIIHHYSNLHLNKQKLKKISESILYSLLLLHQLYIQKDKNNNFKFNPQCILFEIHKIVRCLTEIKKHSSFNTNISNGHKPFLYHILHCFANSSNSIMIAHPICDSSIQTKLQCIQIFYKSDTNQCNQKWQGWLSQDVTDRFEATRRKLDQEYLKW